MTTTTYATAVGVFVNHEQAQQAVNDLRNAGFREDQIGLLTRTGLTVIERNQKVPQGAGIGAATGAGVAALWAVGIATLGLPAVGPVIAGGILATILASAAGGAAVGGLLGALIGFGIPVEEAHYYENEFVAGRTLVMVNADDRREDAVAILRRHGGYDWASSSEFASKNEAALR